MSAALETILRARTGDFVLLVDPASFAIREISNTGLRHLGYRREALVGRQITDIEDSLADTAFWEEMRSDGVAGPHVAVGAYRCAGGDILAARKTVTRISFDDGDCLVVRAEPFKPGTRIEEELAGAASLLRATLEATADGILLLDRNGAIVNMNRRFAFMWGLPDAMLEARDDQAILGFMAGLFADPQAYLAVLAVIPPDGEAESFDPLNLADGRFFERKSMPVRQGGQVVGRAYSFTDLTARRHTEHARARLEAQLRESQKMEAIGTLAGGIAHDFNNIIATILGNTELARQDARENPSALESLEEIRKAATRARDLVQQILSFSRRQPTERKRLALASVVAESVRLLRATVPARVRIDLECAPDLPAALADATQMQQVLINLATNAMQAMGGNPGRIDIRLDEVRLDAALAATHPALHALHAQHAGPVLRLAVRDDGPGIESEVRDRIFEPFFTTKPVDEGTGLGLSVVHGIVRAHEGAIVVESLPGTGPTTFTIYLPCAPAGIGTQASSGAARTPGGAVAAPPANGPHILYLDDDESLVFLVTRVLERSGCRVSTHTSQCEALEALRADPASFDLLVTDYNMPGMSGLDVAKKARLIREDLPVAVASGFVDETLNTKAEGAGVHEVIFKASTVEDFCEVMLRLALAAVSAREND